MYPPLLAELRCASDGGVDGMGRALGDGRLRGAAARDTLAGGASRPRLLLRRRTLVSDVQRSGIRERLGAGRLSGRSRMEAEGSRRHLASCSGGRCDGCEAVRLATCVLGSGAWTATGRRGLRRDRRGHCLRLVGADRVRRLGPIRRDQSGGRGGRDGPQLFGGWSSRGLRARSWRRTPGFHSPGCRTARRLLARGRAWRRRGLARARARRRPRADADRLAALPADSRRPARSSAAEAVAGVAGADRALARTDERQRCLVSDRSRRRCCRDDGRGRALARPLRSVARREHEHGEGVRFAGA